MTKIKVRTTITVINAGLAIIISTLVFNSCNAPEPLSTTPKIALNNVAFKDVEQGQDSLILWIDFEDGNGDIGLRSNETLHPFHEYDVIIDSTASYVPIGDTSVKPPFFIATPPFFLPPSLVGVFFNETDNRPEYSCEHYEIGLLKNDKLRFFPLEFEDLIENINEFHRDTIYVYRNEDRFNIYVEFFRKVGEEYELIDWTRAFDANGCSPDFNARFPVFDEESVDGGSSLEGTIKYSMRSLGFNLLLKQDVFKLRIKIQDRSLNESNIIETGDLTLQGLLEED